MWLFEISLRGNVREASVWQDTHAPVLAGLPDVSLAERYDPITDLGEAAAHHSDNVPAGMLCLGFDNRTDLYAVLSGRALAAALADLPNSIEAFGATFRRIVQPLPGDELKTGGHVSNVVRYRGPCSAPEEFVRAYMTPHLTAQVEFDGIRRILGLEPADVEVALPKPLKPNEYLVGNEVTFDDLEAMNHAMTSPVREHLRGLFHDLPPFEGGNTHHIMMRRSLGRNTFQT